LLQDVDYEAVHVNPEKISNLPYAIKPLSSIQIILDETGKMNLQIRKLVALSPGVEEIVEVRNKKIEEAVKEIESSYNYALHIQELPMPEQGDRLYEEIEKWREVNNEEQTDDILVIGIRI